MIGLSNGKLTVNNDSGQARFVRMAIKLANNKCRMNQHGEQK